MTGLTSVMVRTKSAKHNNMQNEKLVKRSESGQSQFLQRTKPSSRVLALERPQRFLWMCEPRQRESPDFLVGHSPRRLEQCYCVSPSAASFECRKCQHHAHLRTIHAVYQARLRLPSLLHEITHYSWNHTLVCYTPLVGVSGKCGQRPEWNCRGSQSAQASVSEISIDIFRVGTWGHGDHWARDQIWRIWKLSNKKSLSQTLPSTTNMSCNASTNPARPNLKLLAISWARWSFRQGTLKVYREIQHRLCDDKEKYQIVGCPGNEATPASRRSRLRLHVRGWVRSKRNVSSDPITATALIPSSPASTLPPNLWGSGWELECKGANPRCWKTPWYPAPTKAKHPRVSSGLKQNSSRVQG